MRSAYIVYDQDNFNIHIAQDADCGANCCTKIELTRLLFYSDIQPVLIGAIGPFATLAYQASRAF